MPINESLGRPSNLTEKEQREALRAVYGLAEREPMTPTTDLTFEERVKMRRLLDQLDQKEAGGQKEFDLNKPPAPAYEFREFPYLLYHHETGKTRAARNAEERELLITQGWSREQKPAESEGIVEIAEPERDDQGLTAADRAEIEVIDKQLKKKK